MADPQQTKVDGDAVNRLTAAIVQQIDAHMPAIEKLAGHAPSAGSFVNANLLEKVVYDKRDAVVDHGKRLRDFGNSVEASLKKIVDLLNSQDQANADTVKSLTEDMIKDIDDTITKQEAANDPKQDPTTTDDPSGPPEAGAPAGPQNLPLGGQTDLSNIHVPNISLGWS